ncbi:MAG TPA: MarR family transcriptional regulator [Gaiellaceae bacterium]
MKRRRDPILDELGRLTRAIARRVGVEDNPPMTATQRLTLVEIGLDGPLRVNDIARRIGVSTPTASRAVDALVDHGLVTREPDPTDRRALRVDLSDEGRRTFGERMRRANDAFAPAVATLSGREQETLLALLSRLTHALDEAP